MKYTVISGDFCAAVDAIAPRQAAEEAFNLWRLKANKPSLAKITTVVKPNNEEIFLCTQSVLSAT